MRRCTAWQSASPTGPECCTAESAEHPFGSKALDGPRRVMRRLENVRGEFSLTALAYNIRRVGRDPGTDRRGPSVIVAWGVFGIAPPKGLLQRSRAHGISESTTTHSRPKSQASHTVKFDSVLLFTQSGAVLQRVDARRVFKGPGVAKWYCTVDRTLSGYNPIRLVDEPLVLLPGYNHKESGGVS